MHHAGLPLFLKPEGPDSTPDFTGRHLLHPLVADLGEPELDRLSLGAGNALNETQQRFGAGDIGEPHFPVAGGQFQLVTVCYQFTSLFSQAAF